MMKKNGKTVLNFQLIMKRRAHWFFHIKIFKKLLKKDWVFRIAIG